MNQPVIILRFLLILNLVGYLNLSAKSSTTKITKSENEKGHITEITNQAELDANLPAVLEFYSENCGACIMFKKQYERIAKKHPTIRFLKVDGIKHHALVKSYKITAFPSFVFLANNTSSQPKIVVGPKKHDIEVALKDLTEQLQTSTPSTGSIKTVASLDELEKLIRETDKLIVAGYQANWCGACKFFAPKFLEVADQYGDVAIFVKLQDESPQGKEFAKKHQLTSLPTTLIFKDRQPNSPVATIVGGNKEKLIEQIKQAGSKVAASDKKTASARPTAANSEILEIKNKAELDELLKNSSMPVIIDYHAESWCGACKAYKDIFAAFASQFPKLKFAKINGHLPENRAIGDLYNIQKLPTTIIFENGKKTHAIEGINPQLSQILSTLNTKS